MNQTFMRFLTSGYLCKWPGNEPLYFKKMRYLASHYKIKLWLAPDKIVIFKIPNPF